MFVNKEEVQQFEVKDFVLICKVMICQKACTRIYAAPLTLIPYLQKRKSVVCLQINAVYFLSIFFSNEINNNIFILLILRQQTGTSAEEDNYNADNDEEG